MLERKTTTILTEAESVTNVQSWQVSSLAHSHTMMSLTRASDNNVSVMLVLGLGLKTKFCGLGLAIGWPWP